VRTRVKVCCISSREEAAIAVRAGASAIGLVAEMPTGPGTIADRVIADIARAVPPPVSRFLLTSRTDPHAIVEHARAAGVDTVQIVDAVAEGTYAILRDALPHVRIVQVLHVEDEKTIDDAIAIAPHVHALLLDSGRPSQRELGGTGRVHDWAISRRVIESVTVPVWIAGGLRPDNAARAIEELAPFGLDVCSGVRTEGQLDAARLDAFMRAASGAQQDQKRSTPGS
jgi:phosphoribosylanthranilate isomerase